MSQIMFLNDEIPSWPLHKTLFVMDSEIFISSYEANFKKLICDLCASKNFEKYRLNSYSVKPKLGFKNFRYNDQFLHQQKD